jgi:hypothetical protein
MVSIAAEAVIFDDNGTAVMQLPRHKTIGPEATAA